MPESIPGQLFLQGSCRLGRCRHYVRPSGFGVLSVRDLSAFGLPADQPAESRAFRVRFYSLFGSSLSPTSRLGGGGSTTKLARHEWEPLGRTFLLERPREEPLQKPILPQRYRASDWHKSEERRGVTRFCGASSRRPSKRNFSRRGAHFTIWSDRKKKPRSPFSLNVPAAPTSTKGPKVEGCLKSQLHPFDGRLPTQGGFRFSACHRPLRRPGWQRALQAELGCLQAEAACSGSPARGPGGSRACEGRSHRVSNA